MMNVVSLHGRGPAYVFKTFFFKLIFWFDIYALTVARLNFES